MLPARAIKGACRSLAGDGSKQRRGPLGTLTETVPRGEWSACASSRSVEMSILVVDRAAVRHGRQGPDKGPARGYPSPRSSKLAHALSTRVRTNLHSQRAKQTFNNFLPQRDVYEIFKHTDSPTWDSHS